jgi:hypothetical protein
MKKFLITSILAVLAATSTIVRAQDMQEEYLGLPGDNLNLYAVMNLFQESETLEDFERKLNEENSRINNLDLNGDYLVDYITVSDYVDGNVHNIVLRVALNRFENQDVALFTVERLRNGSVQIQLIGDEALYGKNYIIEPYYAGTPNPGYRGNNGYNKNVSVVTTTYYEVAAWPVIRFIYRPTYVVWRSSWYWGYYPVYWNPWRPYYWHYYYGYHSHWYPQYYEHYRHTYYYRYARYNDYYCSHVRAHSAYVSKGVKEGHYKHTYSRPDMKKEGEALYASTQASRSNRSSVNATVNSQEKRTGQAPEAARRSAPVTSGNSAGRQNASQSSSSSRRSAPAATGNSAGKPTVSQGATESRRTPAPQATERPVSKQAPAPSAGRSSARPEQASERPSSSQAAAHRTEPAKASKPSAPAASSQGQRRSSEARPASAPQKSSNASQKSNNAQQKSNSNSQRSSNSKEKESENGKPSRR